MEKWCSKEILLVAWSFFKQNVNWVLKYRKKDFFYCLLKTILLPYGLFVCCLPLVMSIGFFIVSAIFELLSFIPLIGIIPAVLEFTFWITLCAVQIAMLLGVLPDISDYLDNEQLFKR